MKEILKGLKIIEKYNPESDFSVGHDIIYCGDLNMSEEDSKKMEELNWFKNEECDCWSKWV